MRNTRLLGIVSGVLLVALILAGCSKQAPAPTSTTSKASSTTGSTTSTKPAPATSTTSTAAAKAITLKTIVYTPVTDPTNDTYRWFIDTVNQRGTGKLAIQLVGGPEVIPAASQAEAVRLGTFDMALGSPTNYTQAVPGYANTVLLSKLTGAEERESGYYDYVLQQHKQKLNAYYLGKGTPSAGGIYYIFTVSKISTLNDLKDKKLRAAQLFVPFFQSLGISAVTLPVTEVYSALQTHVIEGGVTSILSAVDGKWYEVVKYAIDAPFLVGGSANLINLDKWNSLPKDVQDLLIQAAKDAEAWGHNNDKQNTANAKQKLANFGVQFTKLSPDDEKQYLRLAYESSWDKVKSVVPAEYDQLRKLLRQ
ncbi:MAG: TRAP transporter substrate-binding protein DctP [Chloroflexi bacterium]|nr:TRAP transporter substrate-binding protein DctP [Chloroflexota bacterium]